VFWIVVVSGGLFYVAANLVVLVWLQRRRCWLLTSGGGGGEIDGVEVLRWQRGGWWLIACGRLVMVGVEIQWWCWLEVVW
jgi:hypothetical protein